MFAFFGEQWGVPVAVSHELSPETDIAYCARESGLSDGIVHVPFDASMYDARCRCTAVAQEGLHLWMRPEVAVPSADVVGSSYRLLTLLDEHQVAPESRDRRGIFTAEALPPSRRAVADVPIVDEQAAWLLTRVEIARQASISHRTGKWPSGKRYAIAVTHDTDAISLGAGRELLTNLVKSVIRRNRTYARMFADGLGYIGRPMDNPLFGFPRWRDFERLRELRSAFYLFAKVGAPRTDRNDCKSTVVEQRIEWRLLQDMAADGWEFGFHAPIHAKEDVNAFLESKAWLEERLGTRLWGLRHHYWALDWRAPQTTFAKHAASGFCYDTSIAWRDIAGFRAGTCHPYRPFDPARDERLDLYELPACVMDEQVIRADGDLRRRRADRAEHRRAREAPRRGGGAQLAHRGGVP